MGEGEVVMGDRDGNGMGREVKGRRFEYIGSANNKQYADFDCILTKLQSIYMCFNKNKSN